MSPVAEFFLGPFVVEHPLGRGGMGVVWRGHHAHTGLPVAVKVMTPEKLRKPAFVQAFSDELQAIATLDHPNIVRVFDVSVVDDAVELGSAGRMISGSPYLVMELADGGSLRADPPPRSWDSVRQVLLTLLSALAHAHARGVIHRDIKPGNVLWAPSLQPGGPRRPLLTDFGIAQLAQGIGPRLAGRSSATWGTPAYMAPERFTRQWRDLGPWTDLYSLGCLAYTLLRGRPPYVGKPLTQAIQAHLYGPIPAINAPCPVPPKLDLWLRGMLAKAPIDRFQTAADAAHALRKLGEDTAGRPAENRTSGRTPADLQPPLRRPSIAPAPASSAASVTTEEQLPTGELTVQSAEATWTDDHFTTASTPPCPTAPDDDQARHQRPRVRQGPPPLPSDWRALLPPSRRDDLPGGGLRLFGLRTVALVDRLAERDALWATLKRVCERGRPAGVLLRGAVGTGKTRLAHWLGEQAAVAGAATSLRANHGLGGGVPALAGMVATYLRVGGLGPRALRGRVLAWLKEKQAHSDSFAHDLIAVASLGCGQRMPRAARPRDLHHAVRRFLSILGSERPVVLMLDDVALEPTSLYLARELLEQGLRVPIALVMTARTELLEARPGAAAILSGLADEGRLRTINVAPLAAPHRLVLVKSTLGLQAELGQKVARRTAGNPLFIITLVRDWVARALLTEGPDGLVSTTGSTPPLPLDLHALWSARLRHLLSTGQPTDRPALELAAALGEAVNDDEWRAVCSTSRVALAADLRARLIAERLATPGPMGWRFVHDTVRTSLLHTALEEGRLEAAHAACATMLAQRDAAGDNPLARIRVGRHLAASGRADQALPLLMDGATSLLSDGDPATALLVATEVDHLVHQLAPDDAALPRARALALRADILLEQGHHAQAKRFAHQAKNETANRAEIPTWRPVRAQALCTLTHLATLQGDPVDATRNLEEARRLLGDDARLADVARIRQLTGNLMRLQGKLDQAHDALAEAADLFSAVHRVSAWSACTVSLAQVATDRGEAEQAERLLVQALERYRALRHRRGEANALFAGAHAALTRSEWPMANQRFRRAQAIYQRIGGAGIPDCRLGRARVALEQGRTTEAARLLKAVQSGRPTSRATRATAQAVALLLAATDADWTAFDQSLSDLAGMQLRGGIGRAELHQVAHTAARLASAHDEPERAARTRVVLGS